MPIVSHGVEHVRAVGGRHRVERKRHVDTAAHHREHRRQAHAAAQVRQDRDRHGRPRARKVADLFVVDADAVDEQQIGAEHALPLVDLNRAAVFEVVLGHHAVGRDGQAVLARPCELLLPDVLRENSWPRAAIPRCRRPLGSANSSSRRRTMSSKSSVSSPLTNDEPALGSLDEPYENRPRMPDSRSACTPRAPIPPSTDSASPKRTLRVTRAVGEHHRAEIVRKRAVAGAASQHRRPHVPVGVDQPRHGDHPSAVDDLGAHAVEPPPNAGDPVALDRHVARLQRPQRLAVHGQQIRVTDQIARHDSSSAPAWGIAR